MKRGYTLVEVAIIISIIGIVATLAWGGMSQHFPRYRLVQSAKMLKSHLMKMRKIAVQTNRETRIYFPNGGSDCSDSSNWGTKWILAVGDKSVGSTSWDILPEDASDDGVDDDQGFGIFDTSLSGNEKAIDICLDQWSTMTGPSFNGANNTDAIVFSPRGWVSNPSTDFNSNGYIDLKLVNQVAARSGRIDTITLRIARSGMVRLVAYDGQFSSHQVGSNLNSSQ